MRRYIVILACLCVAIARPVAANGSADVIAEHNSAWSEGDFDAFMATFADDAVVVFDGVAFEGRDAIAAGYAPDFAPGSPRNVIIRQGRGSGGSIVREEIYVFADGSEECCTVSAIWAEDGRIARVIVSHRGG